MFCLRNFTWLLFLGCVLFPHSLPAADKKIKVTATTTMVADLVRSVGGDRVTIETLMGPGVDPHLYKAAASDVTKLQQANVVFYSGLLLEGKMQDIFTHLARSKRHVYAVTESIPLDRLLEPPEFAGHYDPHVWFDVTLWKVCVDAVVKGLSETDAAGKATYERNAAETRKRLDELHAWALAKANELPPERRILVTSHDAYNYFGRAYGFQVVGLQGISTVSEAGLADMAKLSDFIREKGIKAVFVESSVPHDTIERISKDTGAKIGGELFSDAMGTAGQIENGYDLGTYEGMIKHNLNTIVNALK
ncbi:MAG TPA: zinc ABC transporter substrate-binding protein [Chthoniobacterales bacterium]|nr:zinc ABC transporter substrate-binding protein [Chthoniobacterales bacterium]